MRTSPPRITEAEFMSQVIHFARLHSWRVAHFRPGRIINRDGSHGWRTAVQGDGAGFPDLLLIRGKVLIVAELKVGSNRLTSEQTEWLDSFRGVGISAYFWRPEDWPEIDRVLQ